MLSSYGLQMCQVVRRKRLAEKSTEMIEADDSFRPAKRQRTEEAEASPAVKAAFVSEVDDICIDEIDGEADQLLQELAGFDTSEDSTVMGLVSCFSSLWGACIAWQIVQAAKLPLNHVQARLRLCSAALLRKLDLNTRTNLLRTLFCTYMLTSCLKYCFAHGRARLCSKWFLDLIALKTPFSTTLQMSILTLVRLDAIYH